MLDYSIYTYFLCSSTYFSMKSNRIPVTEVSCWIAMIFKSFSRSLSILIDKCVLSDILTYPPFFYMYNNICASVFL